LDVLKEGALLGPVDLPEAEIVLVDSGHLSALEAEKDVQEFGALIAFRLGLHVDHVGGVELPIDPDA
jgi:hypothetical protein